MLMSDTWQPAVLQLFPFSPNDASHPHHHHHQQQHRPPPPLNLTTSLKDPPSSTFPLVKSVPVTPEVSRGFPVLTPTRKENNNGGRGSARMSAGGPGTGAGSRDGEAWGSAPSPAEQKRASLDRVTVSQPSLELGKRVTSSSSSSKPVRVKSEYVIHGRLSGGGKSARRVERHGREKSDGLQSREQTTFSVTDMNERIISRIGLRSDSTSPDSASRSLRNSPYMTSAATQSPVPNGSGGNARSFSKPFLSSALSSSFSAAVRVTANGNGGAGEGRYVVSKNGMWRSVTLTPGEMELKKHRDLLERVTTSHPASEKGDSKHGQQYHKMSVRDLPRSTTPLNDHDPDKLNMKQVIAFLQSKGKSQADAMELPRGLKSNAHQAVMMPRTVKSSAFRGSVRRQTASSTTAEILMRSSVRDSARESRGPSPPSPAATHRGEDGGDALRTSSSLLLRRENTSRSIKSSGKEGKEQRTRKQSALEQQDSRAKLQKKPFRLHRFLTMVPTARDPDTPSSTSLVSSKTCPLYSAVPLMKSSSKSANKERTLCLDLANHSKTQVTQSRSADNKRQGNVHYRLAARPRPSSLRVEQDLSEAQWKLSSDFGDRDIDRSVINSAEHVNAKESKNVIRLPYVSVDSDNEDIGFSPESKRSARSQKHGRYVKTPCLNSSSSQKAEDKATKETEGVDSQWPVDVREVEEATSSQVSTTAVKDAQELHSLTQVSTSSSMLPAPTESTSSLPTVSTGDILSELVHVEDESVDKLSVVLSERELVHSTEGNSVSDRNSETPVPSKKVSVNVPAQNDNAKGNATKEKLPDCVTLSLRKERHRTRENTYMSDIGGSDLLSDDTCMARVDSESLRMSLRGDDAASWMS